MATNMILSGAKKRFSDIRMICTHGGGTVPYLASRISILEPVFGAGPNRAVLSGEEILSGLSTFYFDLTASTAAASLDAIRHLVPASQLMLGFDFPMMPASIIPPILGRDAYSTLPISPVCRSAGRILSASHPPSSSAPPSTPHSARCTAGAQLPSTSCLGAFWTPAATARGRGRRAGVQKPAQSRKLNYSSARASSVGGTSRPSALAVFKLITNSNFVG